MPRAQTETDLVELLDELNIPFTLTRHEALFTVEQSQAAVRDTPGAHCKNMFLKSKSGALILVTCEENRRIRIRDLERAIGVKKLSFAKPDLLLTHLGVTPGAVTPLSVVNDTQNAVRVVLDAQMMNSDTLHCHPLHNEATIAISTTDLIRVFDHTGHMAELVDFDALELAALTATSGLAANAN